VRIPDIVVGYNKIGCIARSAPPTALPTFGAFVAAMLLTTPLRLGLWLRHRRLLAPGGNLPHMWIRSASDTPKMPGMWPCAKSFRSADLPYAADARWLAVARAPSPVVPALFQSPSP
jgi:hypothetical protein